MDSRTILTILQQVQNGQQTPQNALEQLKNLPFEDFGFAKIDHHRNLRRGLPEVIYGENKTVDQLTVISKSLQARHMPVLITRLSEEKWLKLKTEQNFLNYNEAARCAWYREDKELMPGRAVVCAAGTSDLPVSEEAVVTLQTMGHRVKAITDIGVAGLHRMLAHLNELRDADVIIAVAGMEGALPSVMAGLVDCPVIGVPTSVGYGASFGGVTPLLSMLNSCASGVTVVNIDNGFGAAYAAALMLRRLNRGVEE